jgi:wobble nucleotide-excising tRNase
MKKLIKLLMLSLTMAALNAADEVQPVIDITPDRPKLTLPTPPAEIKATDIVQTSTFNRPVAAIKKAKPATKMVTEKKPLKKPFDELTQEEQIKALKRKIDKLRKRSHEMRDKLRKVKHEVAELKQEITDLKESALKDEDLKEPSVVKEEKVQEPEVAAEEPSEAPEEETQEDIEETETQGE